MSVTEGSPVPVTFIVGFNLKNNTVLYPNFEDALVQRLGRFRTPSGQDTLSLHSRVHTVIHT